jgi:hypothetical protein
MLRPASTIIRCIKIGLENCRADNIYTLQKATDMPQKYNTRGTKRETTQASVLELTKLRLQQRKRHSSSLNQL